MVLLEKNYYIKSSYKSIINIAFHIGCQNGKAGIIFLFQARSLAGDIAGKKEIFGIDIDKF
jgi:hypothetical protein